MFCVGLRIGKELKLFKEKELNCKRKYYLAKYTRADFLTRNHSSSSDAQVILTASNQAHNCRKRFFLPKTADREYNLVPVFQEVGRFCDLIKTNEGVSRVQHKNKIVHFLFQNTARQFHVSNSEYKLITIIFDIRLIKLLS